MIFFIHCASAAPQSPVQRASLSNDVTNMSGKLRSLHFSRKDRLLVVSYREQIVKLIMSFRSESCHVAGASVHHFCIHQLPTTHATVHHHIMRRVEWGSNDSIPALQRLDANRPPDLSEENEADSHLHYPVRFSEACTLRHCPLR